MLKPCIHPGCPKVTSRTRCVEHERRYQQERNALPHRQAYKDKVYQAIPLGKFCVDCMTHGSPDNPLTKDHVVPLSRGGWNTPDNIVTRCRSCNSKKGNR